MKALVSRDGKAQLQSHDPTTHTSSVFLGPGLRVPPTQAVQQSSVLTVTHRLRWVTCKCENRPPQSPPNSGPCNCNASTGGYKNIISLESCPPTAQGIAHICCLLKLRLARCCADLDVVQQQIPRSQDQLKLNSGTYQWLRTGSCPQLQRTRRVSILAKDILCLHVTGHARLPSFFGLTDVSKCQPNS